MYLCFEFCTFKILFQNTLQIAKDDFFDFESDNEASVMDDTTQRRDQLSSAVSNVNIECLQYLNEACCSDIIALNNYSTARRLFHRLNAAVPSSATVERLFSKGALITVPRRNRLTDEHFEQLLLLNANSILCSNVLSSLLLVTL